MVLPHDDILTYVHPVCTLCSFWQYWYDFRSSADMLLHTLRTISFTCVIRGSLLFQVLICMESIGDVCRMSIRNMVSSRSGSEDDSGKGSLLSESVLELSLPGYILFDNHTH